jgi:hypothetical protein
MFNSQDKLPQLPANHLIRHNDIVIRLAIMYSEAQPNEVREDGGGAGAGEDGGLAGAG